MLYWWRSAGVGVFFPLRWSASDFAIVLGMDFGYL